MINLERLRACRDPIVALHNSGIVADAADEIERLQKALHQVIKDCDNAYNLSYASNTAKIALGLRGISAVFNRED